MKWKHPNTITGPAAEGDKYFRREEIENRLWREIAKNSHVLFLAPRRVGKSSIVMYMSTRHNKEFACKYENIQSDSSIQAFYKRLCNMTHSALTNYGKSKNWLSSWWNSYTIQSIGKDKIEIQKATIDYRTKFFELLGNLKDHQEKVVLFLDEFPDVIWNINNQHGAQEAETLLNDVRTLRQTKDFKDVFIIVLLGSVGLNHIVKKITGRIDKVNDLHREYLHALEIEQAKNFLNHLIKDATMQLEDATKDYLLNKIGYFIPYYMQLIVEECDDMLKEKNITQLTTMDIDKAYQKIIKKNEHFSDWDRRISKYFPDKYVYLLEVLSMCAHKNGIDLQEIYNIAVSNNNINEWKADIDDILIADGYLYEENQLYAFNSPLLKDWWKARHPLMKKS